MTEALNRDLTSLPPGIAAPTYDLKAVKPGIVHIGLGGFHRAHFARYTRDLMERDPSALGWGIVGAGLRPSDGALLRALDRQNGLYTLVEQDALGDKRTVIGSIVRTIDASSDSSLLLDAIVAPETGIVSVTVSEHGYHLDSVGRSLNRSDPAIIHDISSPLSPCTLLGILVEAYRRRRETGLPPFTALSCDNIQHNGMVLRAAVVELASLSDPDLADWIADHGRFPCSMVDRITPVPTPAQIAAFQEETGLADCAPIFAESFKQWVIEDSFAAGRPAWDRVGAQFVDDVTPYETMKLRLLNASHLAIASLGALLNYVTVLETIGDPYVRGYMARLMVAETGPTLKPVTGIDLEAYQKTLIERFANPAIRDTVQRINADAPINLLLDPLRDRLSSDAPIDLLALGLAAWCQRVKRDAAQPTTGRPMGNAEALLQDRARSSDGPISFLSLREIFGEVGRNQRLVAAVGEWLWVFDHAGVSVALAMAGTAAADHSWSRPRTPDVATCGVRDDVDRRPI